MLKDRIEQVIKEARSNHFAQFEPKFPKGQEIGPAGLLLLEMAKILEDTMPTDRELASLLSGIVCIDDKLVAKGFSTLFAKLTGESSEEEEKRFNNQFGGLTNILNRLGNDDAD